MQEHNRQNRKGASLLGIRPRGWLLILGLALLCKLAINLPWFHRSSPAGEPTSTGQETAQDSLIRQPKVIADERSLTALEEVNQDSLYQSSSPESSVAATTEHLLAIEGELRLARQKLDELRGRYSDQHPEVQAQLRAIESLEQSAAMPVETPELAAARAELAKLKVSYADQHPEVQAQLRAIESLEKSAASKEPTELAQAKAELARLRVRYADTHPAVQAQLQKVAELERNDLK
jgi:hypothetical protein